jgi:hypothetical protein
MRTEFAWMYALQANHFNIHDYDHIKDYDVVFIIFPKATVKLNTVGIEMTTTGADKDIVIYSSHIVDVLKQNNKIVCAIQEGPAWFFNEYDMTTQFNFYNQLAGCDIIFAHNEYDINFYKGLFPHIRIAAIPTLMIINDNTCPFQATPEDKVIMGGNFCRWYGGFQSYIISSEFNCPIFVPNSHCKRTGEEAVPNLNHLPWVSWTLWMKQLSTFKYAVNLMPTVAAGTFNLNCAYFGIPCIGNNNVDTQRVFHPDLSVDVHDVYSSRYMARRLREDTPFYDHCSHFSKNIIRESVHANITKWTSYMKEIIYRNI